MTDYIECTWSEETPDDCPYCSGEACNLCLGTDDCEHDVIDRHQYNEHEKCESLPIPWENFTCYLIDHCEGQTVSEESVQRWLAEMLIHPNYMRKVR